LYHGKSVIDHTQEVVVVTSNYRLNIFGFLGSNQLLQESDTTGLYGLLDQRQAMRWVKQNIQNFGGDPTNVMIYGESAGAGSVSCHLVMPGSFGLYQRALMESGPVARWSSKNMTYAQTQFDLLTNITNCDLSKNELSCLRALPTAVLVNLNLTIPESVMKGVWAPVVDGKQLTADPQILAAQKKFAPGIQVALGTNLNEGSIFIYGVYGFSVTSAEYEQQLQFDFGPILAPEILAQYPVSDYPDPFHALSEVFTDFAFACPARRTARWLTNASIPTYLYQFTHELDEINIFDPSFFGVFHSSELFFVFNIPDGFYNFKVPIIFGPHERELAFNFVDFWSQFAGSGNPGSAGGVKWPLYNLQSDQNVRLDLNITIDQHLKQQKCDFWDQIQPQLPPSPLLMRSY
jgi:para-nitrobenzyl esterase